MEKSQATPIEQVCKNRKTGSKGESIVKQMLKAAKCFVERFKDAWDLNAATPRERSVADFAVAKNGKMAFVEVKTTKLPFFKRSLFKRQQLLFQLSAYRKGAPGFYICVLLFKQQVFVIPWDRVFQWYSSKTKTLLENEATICCRLADPLDPFVVTARNLDLKSIDLRESRRKYRRYKPNENSWNR